MSVCPSNHIDNCTSNNSDVCTPDQTPIMLFGTRLIVVTHTSNNTVNQWVPCSCDGDACTSNHFVKGTPDNGHVHSQSYYNTIQYQYIDSDSVNVYTIIKCYL